MISLAVGLVRLERPLAGIGIFPAWPQLSISSSILADWVREFWGGSPLNGVG
jgi:hypothetical protein